MMNEGKVEGVEQIKISVLPDGRVDRKNASKALNRKPKTLAEWQRLGKGPRPFLVGGRVFYWWAEVQAFGNGATE